MKSVLQVLRSLDEKLTEWGRILEGKTVRFHPSLVGPVLFLAIGILGFVVMPSQVKIQEGNATTARTFPTLMLLIIIVCSVILLAREVLNIIRGQEQNVVILDLLTEVKALLLLVMLLLYALLIPVLGFILTSMLFGFAMLVFFRIRKWSYYLIVTLAALGIGLLFQVVLNVRLP
ncbi:tripartite tricarboxylate transporter TctB family protein [Sphaerochaeta sp.]|jgi:putative tricarboxylic transport membrane protein|uniref:tripartite tricarboxylate transporter TctB family protein n=1 Tax=Sphaerochaeta sp. TaxID=1972642 RepID=UPI002FC5C07B